MEKKTSLTPIEKLKVAHAVIVNGVHQHQVASLMGVNPGRVAEAVKTARSAYGIKTEDLD